MASLPAPPAFERKQLALTRTRYDGEPRQRPLDFQLIRRLLAFTNPYASTRNWLLLLVVLRSIQLPCLAWAIGAIINGSIARHDPTGLAWGAGGFLALAALTQFTFHFRQKLALDLGEAVVHDLRAAIFAHLQRLPLSFYNRTKLGRIISRFTSDAVEVRTGVQDVLFVSLVGLGQMTVAAAFMLWVDPVLFAVVAVMAPVLWGINRHFRKKLSIAYRNVQESFSRVTATLAESVNGVRVTQGYVRQDVNAGLFRELAADHFQFNLKAESTAGLFLPLIDFTSQAFIAVLLVFGGYRVLNPEIGMPIGDLIQFFFLTNQFFQPIQILGNMYNSALTSMAGAERVFGLLDTPPSWTDAPGARPLPPIEGRVEFRDLSFGYDRDRLVLHDVNFVAEPGQMIALVGATGSGKSTITNLVAKFYQPTKGAVLVDSHDLADIETESLHRQLGIVWQQNFLFTGTVMDNIRIGSPKATDEEVIEAARRLDCLDLIEALPLGFQTTVGERGIGLSLGQRQLICFTRALVANPRIVILDEATSSVDTLTEHKVQTALARLLAGRTSFVVAHRLSTIRHADQVLVLSGGRIVERGTHTALVAQGGVYAGLYEQFARQ